MNQRRIHLLGVPIDVLTRVQLLDQVQSLADEGGQRTVSYVNVHVLDQSAFHQDLRSFLSQLDICYCDGRGVLWAARLQGDHLPERITGADWIWDLAARAAGELRICWVAGEPGVSAAAAQALRERHPDLEITAHHGFHAKQGPENDALLARINREEPDIVLVGFGTPLQERWVRDNRARIQAPVVWCLGATADFLSGRVSRGPAWLHNRHEWLARLLADPRRMWRRYLLGNSRVMARSLWAARSRIRPGR